MKKIFVKNIFTIFFVAGGFLGLYLYNLTLNLIFKKNFLVTILRLLHKSTTTETLIILYFLLFVLGGILFFLRRWIKLNIKLIFNLKEVTLILSLKTLIAGFTFAYILITILWTIVMIIIKTFMS